MQNNYHYRFKHFDPRNGNLPEPYAVLFVELNYRARKILDPFSSDEINLGIQAINKFTRDEAFIDPLFEDLKNEPIKTPMYGQVFDVIPTTNDIEAIFNNMGNISLTKFIDAPNFEWPQLFASIALYHSELILSYLNSQAAWKSGTIFPRPTDEALNNHINEFLTDAKQAITFAELLLKQKIIQKQMQSAQASKAAKNRFAKTSDPLKNLVITIYSEKYQSRSNRDAAARIFKDLLETRLLLFDANKKQSILNGKLALSNDDPEHQFAKWIGEHKKSLS